ncbi:hypothetical protein ACFX11_033461 [Malus domestica]
MNSNRAQFSAGLPTRPKLHRDFSFLTIRVLQTQRYGDGNRNRTFAVICHTFQFPEGSLQEEKMKVNILRGMLLLHGHGMHRTKHVGFVGWHLMVVVPIVNSLGMIAR